MDNLTHGLLGAAIGMLRRRDGGPENDAPVSDTDKAVMWAAVLAAEAPDLDVFLGSGPLDEFIYHRAITHSVVASPVMALAVAGLTWCFWRQARFTTIWFWALLSVTGHIINDWMTGWGTRVLLPFSEVRFGLDWVPIIDLLYTLPLLAAVVIAWRKPLLRRKAMLGIFTYLALYTIVYRGGSQWVIERSVEEKYGQQSISQMRVAPNLFNPLQWIYTVDLGDRYEQGRVYPFGQVNTELVTPKAGEDAVVKAVRNTLELKPFFDQFGYPLITYERLGDGYKVTLKDVRYSFMRAGLSFTVELDPNYKVVKIDQSRW